MKAYCQYCHKVHTIVTGDEEEEKQLLEESIEECKEKSEK